MIILKCFFFKLTGQNFKLVHTGEWPHPHSFLDRLHDCETNYDVKFHYNCA